jgi:hypothetical protein
MLIVWISLAVSVVLVALATIRATRRGLRLFRDAKGLGAEIEQEVRRIETASGEIQVHLEAAERSSEALSAATARLGRSRARLNVLLAEISDVRTSIRLVLAFAPRK